MMGQGTGGRPSRWAPLSGLVCATLLAGCSGGDSEPELPRNDVPMAVLDDAALQELEGIYEQTGYGDLYVFADGRTTLYSLTENQCLEVATFAGLAGLTPAEVEQTRYALEDGQLTLDLPGSAFVTRYDRLEQLPERCNDTVARDAQGVFDFLWQTFDEYYAFFELRGVDWAAEYASRVPGVAAATDDEALFGLLSELLSPVNDDHVFLVSDTDFYSPAELRGAELELQRGFEAQTQTDDFDAYIDAVLQQFIGHIRSRLDADSLDEEGPMLWGTMEDGSTGYLFIGSMAGYARTAEGEPDDEAGAAVDVAAAAALMDRVMADLADTSRLIIDVRLNGGGRDAIGFDVASRFVSERQLAFSKSARSRGTETAPVQAWLEPLATGAYLNPVTVIVGSDTVSAAETFAIPMHRLPQVTLVGENTAGALSDILVKPLPNGWAATVSNEVYLDSEGVSFEGVGVAPDIAVPVFRLQDIQAGTDPALDRALEVR